MGNARRPFAVLRALTAAIVLGSAANAQAQNEARIELALLKHKAPRLRGLLAGERYALTGEPVVAVEWSADW